MLRDANPREDFEHDRADGTASLRETAAGELDGLFRFAISQVDGDWHRARDVVQQAVRVALAHARAPSDASSQRAWLRGIVRNVARRERRSRWRLHGALRRLSTERERPALLVESPDADRAARVRAVFGAVAQLDTAEQSLFYAFYRAGRSHASIAEELGTTHKSVEARLYRLRHRLRTLIAADEEKA